MKYLFVVVLITTLCFNTGCATLACSLLCEDDAICYSTCRGINDAFEEGYE